MKKILLICLLLLPAMFAQGWGGSQGGWNSGQGWVISAIDPDAQRFIDSAVITDNAQKIALSNLVKDMKAADSLWIKMKAVYPFIGGTDATHKWNLKNPQNTDAAFRITWSGTVTHNSSGIQSNGTNGYGDTKFNPVTQSSSLTSFSMGVYKTGTEAGGTSRTYISANDATTGVLRLGWFIAGSVECGVIAGSGTTEIAPPANSQSDGLVGINTYGNRNAQLWTNGAKDGVAVTQTQTMPNFNLFLLANNALGTPNLYTLNTVIKFAYIADGLTDAENLALYNAVLRYQTALGRN